MSLRRASGGGTFRWRHPLVPILFVAMALRAWSAASPVIAHPDEIYQYLEPAHRLLTGEGIVTWEWRLGMRSWLLPILLAPAVALGTTMGPAFALFVPRLAAGAVSLAVPVAAWFLGARISRLHAVVAATVAATWFEFVFFAGHTLSEPIAIALILPAAVWLTAKTPRQSLLALAGILLGMAVLLRPHYAPASIVLVLTATGWKPRVAWLPVALGAGAAFATGAAIDLAMGMRPFAWVLVNVRANIIEHRADLYGTAPALAYIVWIEYRWRWWALVMLLALRSGWRHCPPLLWMAATNLVVHMAIAHKEYRFVLLSGAAVTILAALGTADLVRSAQRRWPGPVLPAAALGAWMVASFALYGSASMAPLRSAGRAGTALFAEASRRHACGVALYQFPHFADVPGMTSLPPHTPIHLFIRYDPLFAHDGRAAALAAWQSRYDTIVASTIDRRAVPDNYAAVRCVASENGPMCLFVRPGGCDRVPTAPTLANAALARVGM